jgi:hypothetical protein
MFSFNGKLIAAYWQSHTVRDRTIRRMLVNLRIRLPAVNGIAIKTNTGAAWTGIINKERPSQLDITGISDVQRWVEICSSLNLDCITWSVVQGLAVGQELDLLEQVCHVPQLAALILDVETGPTYFKGNQEIAGYMASEIRRRAPEHLHIGLCFDARGQHPNDIHLTQWLPHVNSLHPMVYPETFQRDPVWAVKDALFVVSKHNLPVTVWVGAHSLRNANSLLKAVPTIYQLGQNTQGLVLWRYGDDVTRTREVNAIRKIKIPNHTVTPRTSAVWLRLMWLPIRQRIRTIAYRTRLIKLLHCVQYITQCTLEWHR